GHQQPVAQVVVERVSGPLLALAPAEAALGVGGLLQATGVGRLEVGEEGVKVLLRQAGQRPEDLRRRRDNGITDHSFSSYVSIHPSCTLLHNVSNVAWPPRAQVRSGTPRAIRPKQVALDRTWHRGRDSWCAIEARGPTRRAPAPGT